MTFYKLLRFCKSCEILDKLFFLMLTPSSSGILPASTRFLNYFCNGLECFNANVKEMQHASLDFQRISTTCKKCKP